MRRYVSFAQVLKTYGRNGAVAIKPELEIETEKLKGVKIFVAPPLRNISNLTVREARAKGRRLLIFFEEIETIENAEKLIGRTLQISNDDLRRIALNSESSIEGFICKTTSGMLVGEVQKVLDYPAHKIIAVRYKDKEILIPFVKEFVRKVDEDARELVLDEQNFLKNWGENV